MLNAYVIKGLKSIVARNKDAINKGDLNAFYKSILSEKYHYSILDNVGLLTDMLMKRFPNFWDLVGDIIHPYMFAGTEQTEIIIPKNIKEVLGMAFSYSKIKKITFEKPLYQTIFHTAAFTSANANNTGEIKDKLVISYEGPLGPSFDIAISGIQGIKLEKRN